MKFKLPLWPAIIAWLGWRRTYDITTSSQIRMESEGSQMIDSFQWGEWGTNWNLSDGDGKATLLILQQVWHRPLSIVCYGVGRLGYPWKVWPRSVSNVINPQSAAVDKIVRGSFAASTGRADDFNFLRDRMRLNKRCQCRKFEKCFRLMLVHTSVSDISWIIHVYSPLVLIHVSPFWQARAQAEFLIKVNIKVFCLDQIYCRCLL